MIPVLLETNNRRFWCHPAHSTANRSHASSYGVGGRKSGYISHEARVRRFARQSSRIRCIGPATKAEHHELIRDCMFMCHRICKNLNHRQILDGVLLRGKCYLGQEHGHQPRGRHRWCCGKEQGKNGPILPDPSCAVLTHGNCPSRRPSSQE